MIKKILTALMALALSVPAFAATDYQIKNDGLSTSPVVMRVYVPGTGWVDVWQIASDGGRFTLSPEMAMQPITAPTCSAGEFFIWVDSSDNTWRRCENGVASLLGAAAGSGEANTASNLGAGQGVFAGKVLEDLTFKSLVAGTNVSLTSDANEITINATGGSGYIDGSGVASGVIKATDGAAGAPSYTFNSDPDTGMYWNSANIGALSAGGARAFFWTGTYVQTDVTEHRFNGALSLRSDANVAFSSTTNPGSTKDTNLSRISAGVLGVGNGTAGDVSGTVQAAAIGATSGQFQVGTFSGNGNALAFIYNGTVYARLDNTAIFPSVSNTFDLGKSNLLWRTGYFGTSVVTPSVELGTAGSPTLTSGSGSPEGVVTAPVGSSYARTDGGTGTSWYVKESGAGNTGWVAIGAAGSGGHTIEENGTPLTARTGLNFGTGILAADDAANDETDVSIVESELTLDNLAGSLSITKGGTGNTTSTGAFDALAPTTTKGDVIVHNGTDNIRLAAGADGLVLKTNSATASGLEWATDATGGGGGTGVAVGVSLYGDSVSEWSINSSTDTILGWDSEHFDTHGFHDTVTNNSRITVPAGYGGTYTCRALIQWDDNTVSTRTMRIKKNGTMVRQSYLSVASTGGMVPHVLWTGSLAAGDYMEVEVYQGSGSTRVINGEAHRSNFECYAIGGADGAGPPSLAVAHPSVNQGPITASTWTKVTLDVEDVDVGGDFASSTFTTPATGNYMVCGQVYLAGTLADNARVIGGVRKNGSDFILESRTAGGTNVPHHAGTCTVANLTSGDTLELYAYSESTSTIQSGDGTRLAVYSLENSGGGYIDGSGVASGDIDLNGNDLLDVASITNAGGADLVYSDPDQNGTAFRLRSTFNGSDNVYQYFDLANINGANTPYAYIVANSRVRTAGAEDGTLRFYTRDGGTGTEFASADSNFGWGLAAGRVFGWATGAPLVTFNTGLSRISDGVVGVGNGTAGDVSGTVQAASVDSGAATNLELKYNGSSKVTIGSGQITMGADISVSGNRLYGGLRLVQAKTANYTLTWGDDYRVITNAGATGGITLTAASAGAGRTFTIVDNNATHRITIVPSSGDQIIWKDGTVVSAATGSIVTTARYQSLTIEAIDSDTYLVTEVQDLGTAMTVTP